MSANVVRIIWEGTESTSWSRARHLVDNQRMLTVCLTVKLHNAHKYPLLHPPYPHLNSSAWPGSSITSQCCLPNKRCSRVAGVIKHSERFPLMLSPKSFTLLTFTCAWGIACLFSQCLWSSYFQYEKIKWTPKEYEFLKDIPKHLTLTTCSISMWRINDSTRKG